MSLQSFARRVLRRLQRVGAPAPAPKARKPNRYTVQTPAEAIGVLATLAVQARGSGAVLLAGDDDEFHRAVGRDLESRGVPVRRVALDAIGRLPAAEIDGAGVIALATLDSRKQLAAGRSAVRHPALASLPLEYVALPAVENAPAAEWDHYRNADFVSTLLSLHGQAFYDVYRDVLRVFKQKTDIRDYLDLCQLLRSLVERRVPGNVAEFGSYEGHSGYLMSRVLELLGSDKRLFMFDMFEHFPEETVGVDRFWSKTHHVDFEGLRRKFADRPGVQLVKGDFTKTLPATDTGPLALTFVDCDSYRGTRYLLETLWDTRVVPGGIVAMEDYGHAALLGNRIAVHEFFDGRRDAYTFYSHFSGFFVAVKLPPLP